MNKRASLTKTLFSFFGVLLLILTLRWVFFEPYVIPSGSMIPTLLINDHILVKKYTYGIRWPFSKKWILRFSYPKRGEIVVFHSLGEKDYFMVKRLIGLPGDEVRLTSDGQLQINSRLIPRKKIKNFANYKNLQNFYNLEEGDLSDKEEAYSFYTEELGGKSYQMIQFLETKDWSSEAFIIPEAKVLVMGDNRDNSSDGRYWGFLPMDNIIGEASSVWLSCYESLVGSRFLCKPSSIRWKRFFHFLN